jgi:inorganic triphosphatase YgiF
VAVELELKYSSPEGAVPGLSELTEAFAPLRLAVRPLGTSRHLDVYFDDPALALERRGLALRVRASHGAAVATVKGRGDAVRGVFEREELEAPLTTPWPPSLGAEASTAPDWPTAVAARLAGLVELPALEPRLEIETTRVAFALERAGPAGGDDLVAELAFDEVACRPPRGRGDGALIDAALFSEVEIEARGDTTGVTLLAIGEALERLLPLVAGSASKLERAASLLAPFIE